MDAKGRVPSFFRKHNVPAIGIEPSRKSREYCQSQGLEVYNGSFETILVDINGFEARFGGIWCAGSLLHVPEEEAEETIKNLYHILEENGVLFITLRLGNKAKWDKYDDEDVHARRFIQLYDEKYLEEILEKAKFNISLKLIEDSYWGRPSQWISIIAVK